jgi:hypothetical protein
MIDRMHDQAQRHIDQLERQVVALKRTLEAERGRRRDSWMLALISGFAFGAMFVAHLYASPGLHCVGWGCP